MFLSFNKTPSLGKKKPGCKPTKESTFFLKLRHLVSMLSSMLARIPLRLAKAGEIVPAPELHFESSGKWEKIHGLALELKHHQVQPLGWCGRAGSLAAGLGAHVQQLRSSWEMCDMWPWCWGSCQLKCCLGLLSGPWILLLSWGLCSVLEASLEQLYMVSLLLSEDICIAGSSYNNSVNMNEHFSLIMSS